MRKRLLGFGGICCHSGSKSPYKVAFAELVTRYFQLNKPQWCAMAEDHKNSFKDDSGRIEGLAYEPVGATTERVRRLKERDNPSEPFKITRHKNLDEHLFGDAHALPHNTSRLPRHNLNEHLEIPQVLLENTGTSNDIYKYSRKRMVQEQLVARGITDTHVLSAMERIPRHLFVSEALHATAYSDRPLPIASGQTISQPYVVALMCQLLLAKPGMRVLEVGTGSGYQAAVLHEMGLHVFSVERVPNLYETTTPFLTHTLGYQRMHLRLSDGTLGLPAHAPYDRIIVAAGGPVIPEALKGQLKNGGIMVIPVGEERKKQHLARVFKINNHYQEENCGAVSFVDLVGNQGWR